MGRGVNEIDQLETRARVSKYMTRGQGQCSKRRNRLVFKHFGVERKQGKRECLRRFVCKLKLPPSDNNGPTIKKKEAEKRCSGKLKTRKM